MHAKHTKQAGQARYANQANQAGRQGKPGRAQAVATQLSPISKLDVCRSATCISSQQDRNMFILSLAIPTHWQPQWQPQSVATPLPPISKLDVFLFATYILSTGSQNVHLFFCLIHTLAGTSSVNAAISNFKIGRLSVCDLYAFSTGSQNVYLFLGHVSHVGHVCLAAGSFPIHFGTTLLHLCVCLAAGSSNPPPQPPHPRLAGWLAGAPQVLRTTFCASRKGSSSLDLVRGDSQCRNHLRR